MNWRVVVRPEVRTDLDEAAAWYEGRRVGLGREFVAAVAKILPALADNPYLNSRRHRILHIRWRYPERFPYRIIYRVDEADKAVVVVAVLHAADTTGAGTSGCRIAAGDRRCNR